MYIIMGIGISSIAAIKKLKELKQDFIVIVEEKEICLANKYHDNVICYKMVKYLNLNKIKYVVKSPGIPYYNEYVKYFKSKHVKVINEIELTYILTKGIGKYIGVSGSVGKSSVVTLLYKLIKSKTDNVILAGNIGDPLINHLDKINKDTIIILEISSFQLDDFVSIRLNIALLLNIFDNHLDFYKKKEIYYLSKFKLTNNQNSKDYFIVNLDNIITQKYLSKHCFKSKLIDYKSNFNIISNYLYYYGKRIISLGDFHLKGKHNVDNLKSVICIMRILNIEIDIKILKQFKTLPYHLEEKKINELTIVNDSKSTCIDSVKGAIQTYKNRRIILLFGGFNKNLNFNFLNNYKFKYVICFGKLANEISKEVNYDIKFDSLKEASMFAFKIASGDDVILFSPGCSSFDQFENYLKRGEAFNEYIEEYYNDKNI